MTTTTILVVSGITAAFLVFGATLAWADFYARGAVRELTATPPPQQQQQMAPASV